VPVSRLDSFIRRLEAQRACLEAAADLISDLDGELLELGLGNGRTYDHLRKLFPHQFLLLGDMRVTLQIVRARLTEHVVLAHLDPGNGNIAASKALADHLAPLIVPLLQLNGVLVSEPAVTADELSALPLPDGIEVGRYNLYRRVRRRSPP
jgi:hypothetical protein